MIDIEEQTKKLGGWCDPKKASKLFDLVIDHGADVIVDVGVFEGKSTLAMARACEEAKRGVVYAVDSWSLFESSDNETEGWKEYWSAIDFDAAYHAFLSNIVEMQLGKYVNVIKTNSNSASRIFSGIDILHIDANHAEYPSTSDVMCWLPTLKTGGLLIMDDTHFDTVQTAYRLAKTQCKLVEEIALSESHYSIMEKL